MKRLVLTLTVIALAGGRLLGGPQGRAGGIGGAPTGPLTSRGGVGPTPTREALALAADGRWFCPYIAKGERNVPHTPDHPEIRAIQLLNAGLVNRSTPPQLRRLAIMGLARTGGNMTQVADVHPDVMLDNDDPTVRRTAADAIGLSFEDMPRDPIYGVSVMPPWSPAQFTLRARELLGSRLHVETEPLVAAAILRTLARLPMDVSDAALAEAQLAENLAGNSVRATGAIAGLEILARRAPKRAFAFDTIRRLHDLAEGSTMRLVADRPPNDPTGAKAIESLAALRRVALLTLHETGSDSDQTLLVAMRDSDWQVRRLAATYAASRDDATTDGLTRLLVDPVFQVRAAALVSLAPRMQVTLSCGPLRDALNDVNPAVVMTAIDVAPPNCKELDVLLEWMRQKANALATADSQWQVGARALAALVRLKDPGARALNASVGATHGVWQVRQLAADLAATLKDEPTAFTLAADSDFNVRAAALRTLTALESPRRGAPALATLRAGRQATGIAVLAAAAALPVTTPLADAEAALDRAFNSRVSTGRREVALGLIASYRRFKLNDSRVLREALTDADPVVAEAAAGALTQFLGRAVPAEPHLRQPSGLTTFQLRMPSRFATVDLSDGGSFRIELLVDEAPVTAAMWTWNWSNGTEDAFIEVAPGVGARSGGFYNNTADATAFSRDEFGEVSHTRGSIAMMSAGPDLVTGQIFIDLIDRPDLDHAYTVFARIVSGIEAADRILEGVKIARVRFER